MNTPPPSWASEEVAHEDYSWRKERMNWQSGIWFEIKRALAADCLTLLVKLNMSTQSVEPNKKRTLSWILIALNTRSSFNCQSILSIVLGSYLSGCPPSRQRLNYSRGCWKGNLLGPILVSTLPRQSRRVPLIKHAPSEPGSWRFYKGELV